MKTINCIFRQCIFSTTVFISLFVCGCNQNEQRSSELQAQTEILSNRCDSLQSQLNSLKTDLESLQEKQYSNELDQEKNQTAFLTPGSNGYSVIKTDIGLLTVDLEDVKPYANGSRVTLSFGNLSNATIEGVKATFQWGSVNSDGLRNYSSDKTREITFNESFSAGAWTTVHVVLENVPPIKLGFVDVSNIQHTAIRLPRK